MRKLNYDIAVGTVFELPKMSWQVAEIAGSYKVQERKTEEWQCGDIEVSYLCVSLDRPYQSPVEFAEMTLAYLLGEEVEADIGVIYKGIEYQPSQECYKIATEDEGVNYEMPFWYLGHCRDKYSIDVSFETGKWCFFQLPWD